jgi:hypothetical protein
MKLLVDPFIDAHQTNLLDVSGTRPECQTIQDMNDLLVDEKFLIKASGSVPTEAKSRYKQRRAEQPCNAFHGLPFEWFIYLYTLARREVISKK